MMTTRDRESSRAKSDVREVPRDRLDTWSSVTVHTLLPNTPRNPYLIINSATSSRDRPWTPIPQTAITLLSSISPSLLPHSIAHPKTPINLTKHSIKTAGHQPLTHRNTFELRYSQKVSKMRGNANQTKVHFKGKNDDYVIFAESAQIVKDWKSDKTIPLAQVVNGWKVFVTHK